MNSGSFSLRISRALRALGSVERVARGLAGDRVLAREDLAGEDLVGDEEPDNKSINP